MAIEWKDTEGYVGPDEGLKIFSALYRPTAPKPYLLVSYLPGASGARYPDEDTAHEAAEAIWEQWLAQTGLSEGPVTVTNQHLLPRKFHR